MRKTKKVTRRYHAVARIAAENDISEGMVYKLIAGGFLEADRFGRAVRVTNESYQRYLKSVRDSRAGESAA